MFRKTISFLGTKIGLSLIASVVIVVCAFIVKDVEFFKGKTSTSAQLSTEREATKHVFEKDTDSDGLKDWEEVLYGMDVSNPDTLGNGLGDAEEIKKMKLENIEADMFDNATSSAPNATDRFSRELFTKYIEAKQAGNDITPELSEAIANEVLSKSYDVDIAAFDESRLTVVSSSDASFIRSYGNSLGTVVSTPLPEGTSNELLILEQITARESASDKNKADLDRLFGRYTKMRDDLVAMRVPAETKDAHVQLVQGIELMINVVTGIKNLGSDPISSLPKVSQYEDAIDLLSAASMRLTQYFMTKGVSFSTYESGSVFMQ